MSDWHLSTVQPESTRLRCCCLAVLTPVFDPACTDKLAWPRTSLALAPWAHAEVWASTRNSSARVPSPMSLVTMIRVCTAHSVRKTKPGINASSRSPLLQDLCPTTTYWHAPPHIAPPPTLTCLPHYAFPPELYAVSSRTSAIMVGCLASHGRQREGPGNSGRRFADCLDEFWAVLSSFCRILPVSV